MSTNRLFSGDGGFPPPGRSGAGRAWGHRVSTMPHSRHGCGRAAPPGRPLRRAERYRRRSHAPIPTPDRPFRRRGNGNDVSEPIVLTAARRAPMPPSPRRRRPERTPTSLSPRLSICRAGGVPRRRPDGAARCSTRGSRLRAARRAAAGGRAGARPQGRQSHRPAFHGDYRSPAVPDLKNSASPTALCRAAG